MSDSLCVPMPITGRTPAPYPWHVHPTMAKIMPFSAFPAVQCSSGGWNRSLVESSAHLCDERDSHRRHIALQFLFPSSFLLETSMAFEAIAATLHRVTRMGATSGDSAVGEGRSQVPGGFSGD